MNINSADMQCRYLAAPGTQVERSSPFDELLKKHHIDLKRPVSLGDFVLRGWVKPRLRIAIPHEPFLTWSDFPNLSMEGTDSCPESDTWALSLYARAFSDFGRPQDPWWLHHFDNPDDPLTKQATAHAMDSASVPDGAATHFHPRVRQPLSPWIDYFAYWQIYEIVEILHAVTYSVRAPEGAIKKQFQEPTSWWCPLRGEVLRVVKRWSQRASTFEWLSMMRTVLGSSVSPIRSQAEVDVALKFIATKRGLTTSQMAMEVRDTLLVMWEDWTGTSTPLSRQQSSLLELLRQDVEYAVVCIERISGRTVDYRDPVWHDDHQAHPWSPLIKALPREEELARDEFPHQASLYLAKSTGSIPQISSIGPDALRTLINVQWNRSRATRRFVLAFHRLHEQLHGQRLMASEEVIRKTEVIDQMNLAFMHAERVLSFESRQRSGSTTYPEIRALAKDSLDHVLRKLGVAGSPIVRLALERAHQLLQERAMLHDLDSTNGLRLVLPKEVATGSDAADTLVAAFVNFVIARNYAAHHDALDDEMVYPSNVDTGRPHQGGLALSSVLLVVVAVLFVAPSK